MDFTQEKCPICYEPFNYNNKPYLLLICGHTFCNSCISRIKKECIEEDSQYKPLSEFYHEQKNKNNLCDSQTSIFSDNYKKKSDSDSDDEIDKENFDKQDSSSKQEDSYVELEDEEEKKEKNDEKKEKIEEKKQIPEIKEMQVKSEIQEQPNLQRENSGDNSFNPFIKPWKETESQIKEKSRFKLFKSLSIVSFIVKAKDDLRQEVMTMQLIKKYDEIFKNENIPLKLHPYEIIITSNSSGLIEFLPDTISFDALKKKLLENNLTFIDFFINHFGDDFEESQKNFAESLAGYSLVCYLLAIKDRHNGNILLDKDGCIIHIDFGFILGISPGGNLNFENAPFKITRDYINLMGGIDSSIFCYFKSLFLRGLFAARRNVDVIANLIEAMGLGVPMPCFNGRNIKEIINAFKERCFVKYSEVEIVPLVNNLFDRSVNSWRTTQYDYFQKLTNNIQP